MAPAWQAPDDWQKDGSIISGVTSLKTGAWTSMLSAKEVKNGREIDVVIKTFSVPAHILEDPERIAREREKFLASARLQKQLSDANCQAWIQVLRISEDPNNTSFSMAKSGASLQDIINRKVNLTAKDLYEVTLAVLQGFDELYTRHKRSHGSLKASDVLNLPGQNPPYRISDPSPKGESHSANDLYNLGLILFQLIEHKEWDPLTPIIPTSNWARFKGRRDRWIQFLHMLLSPTGCQESLANVRKEALRLKPASPMRTLVIVGSTMACLGCAGIGVVVLAWPMIKAKFNERNNAGGGGGGGGPVVVVPPIDPQVKADWDKAHDGYLGMMDKWQNREISRQYDHAKSQEIYRAVRPLSQVATDTPLTNNDNYKKSLDAYNQAAAKILEALTQYGEEAKAGQALDADALADFQKAQETFSKAKTDWDAEAAAFDTKHNHAPSIAFVQATPAPPTVAPPDANGRHAAADQLLAAAARYTMALEMSKKESLEGKTLDQAKADFQAAKSKFLTGRDRWDSSSAGLAFDISAIKAAAEKARASAPADLELTDVASYQKATDAYAAAAVKFEEANTLLDRAKRDHNAQETDAGTSLARAAEAMDKKDYPTALAWYRKAADLGNAVGMYNVGLSYELGRGTDKNAAEAAKWFTQAADLNQTPAMVHLGLLYERGQGVEKNPARAMTLYKKAADLKDPDGIRNTAYLYDNGIGVDKDQAAALTWYRKGADLNDAAAMFCVGRAYEQGRGTNVNYVEAMNWYTRAAALQSALAMNAMGEMYDDGRGVKTDPAQAMAWYMKAAALNLPKAMCNVGGMYDGGIGVPLDHVEALKWFRKGADLGDFMSMYNIGILYETGRGTPQDTTQALSWYRKAANQTEDPHARQLATDRLGKLGFRP